MHNIINRRVCQHNRKPAMVLSLHAKKKTDENHTWSGSWGYQRWNVSYQS